MSKNSAAFIAVMGDRCLLRTQTIAVWTVANTGDNRQVDHSPLSPVHTSNSVEATLSKKVACCFDNVAVLGNNGRVLKYAPECFEVLLCRLFYDKRTAQ